MDAMTSSGERLADRHVARPGPPAGLRDQREHARVRIEIPRGAGEGSTAVERFERQAHEIARAAENCGGTPAPNPADFLPAFPEERLPEILDERALPGPCPAQQSRRDDHDTSVEQRAIGLPPEGRDSVPFGLKRRLPGGLSVLQHSQGRDARGIAAMGGEGLEVRCGAGVRAEQEVLPGRKAACDGRGSGVAEELSLVEEGELRKIRRAVTQVAFDLLAEMMEIDCRLAHARRARRSAPGGEEEGPNRSREA
jgi:hypothetical protein